MKDEFNEDSKEKYDISQNAKENILKLYLNNLDKQSDIKNKIHKHDAILNEINNIKILLKQYKKEIYISLKIKNAIKSLDPSNIKSKNKHTIHIYESAFKKNLKDFKIKSLRRDFYEEHKNPDSCFWKRMAENTKFTANMCFSNWINSLSNYIAINRKEEEYILKKGQEKNPDWVELSIELHRPVLEIFKKFNVLLRTITSKQRNFWTEEEDELLKKAVLLHGEGKWILISQYVITKSPKQCIHRYRNKFNRKINHGRWKKDEDLRLLDAISNIGEFSWCKIADLVETRSDAQCRERYKNVLDPNIKKYAWTKYEDELLITLTNGSKSHNWSQISREIIGRTDCQCRRRYHELLRDNNSK